MSRDWAERRRCIPSTLIKMKTMPRPPKVADAGSGGEEGQQP